MTTAVPSSIHPTSTSPDRPPPTPLFAQMSSAKTTCDGTPAHYG